jgi:hypothetical protein
MKKKEIIIIASVFATLLMIGANTQAEITPIKPSTKPLQITTTITYQFSTPLIQQTPDGSSIQLPEATGYRNIPGEPIVPLLMNTLQLPFGSRITDVHYTVSTTPETRLTQKITPAVKPVPFQSPNQDVVPTQDQTIYQANQLFPDTWYAYRLTGGLNNDNILTTFLTIQINPMRYNPVQDTIQCIDSITLTVTYEPPAHPFAPASDAYDMIIICPDSYAPLLDPLVNHKNSHGIQTKIITLGNIYSETYFPVQGRDNPEKIKYFIKDAKEAWNITYVLLFGSFQKVPGRYSSLETDTGGAYEELEFASDLYFADLYNANGSFSSWDTDNDGLYAEWPYPESHPWEDIVDLAPDVHVGRLACMFKSEVKTMIDKIITYENTTAGQDWFNWMVVVGGDTFDKSWEGGTDYNEGEVATEQALTYMPQFTPIRLWTSLENLTTGSTLTAINAGCGFLYFCGHGSPQMWATHANGDYKTWLGEFRNTDILFKLSNTDMYPVLMVGGCHNSEIDVAPINFIKGLLEEKLHYFSKDPNDFGSFWKYKWALECWSWTFVKARGGAIASIGSSGYGGVNIGDFNHDGIPDCVQGADGWVETEFFRLYNEYNQENVTLGQNYDQVITGYTQNFPIDADRYDAKIVETHILLGDPSLKIGGYQ